MHVAIIMDGNGRWALRRGRPRSAGHAHGARAVRAVTEAAVREGIDTLTLYAFSCDNWGRPAGEIAALMRLFRRYLKLETKRCLLNDVRVNVIGRRDRLDFSLLRAIERCERLTRPGRALTLRIAIDYSSRYNIMAAARSLSDLNGCNERDFGRALDVVSHSEVEAGPVDLLIRTGEERRLSDFLLWECAYAELYFSECMWPDFDGEEFRGALRAFAARERRFGRLAPPRADESSRQSSQFASVREEGTVGR
jgi:undecaprenyl diphosphate synthase